MIMKFKKIVLLDFDKTTLEKEYLDKLSELAETVKIVEEKEENKLEKIKDTDVLLTRISTKVDKNLINNCKNLKYVGVFATAFDAIDIKYAAEKDITVTNLAGYSTEAVAEFLFAVLLEHIRKLERAKNQARNKDYSFDKFLSWELKDKILGIIGLGNIGKRVSEIALSFGLNVIYWSRTRKQEYEDKGVKFADLDRLLKTSDIITIHLALNEETKEFLNKERLEKIKKETILICLAPIELIEFEALINFLKAKQFVFITDHADLLEEHKRNKLENVLNCIIYPPVAFRTKEAIKRQKDLLIDNLVKFSRGVIQNKVN